MKYSNVRNILFLTISNMNHFLPYLPPCPNTLISKMNEILSICPHGNSKCFIVANFMSIIVTSNFIFPTISLFFLSLSLFILLSSTIPLSIYLSLYLSITLSFPPSPTLFFSLYIYRYISLTNTYHLTFG